MTDAQPDGDRHPVVLIAEDDRDIRELVTVKLGAAGYRVIAVEDGLQALRQIRELLPSVALLDVMMPGISGLDIIATLRRDPATATVPVILMSARSQEFDVQSGLSQGAVDYIVKPFSPRELVTRVEAVLQRPGQ
ncbi:MAG TPA: response regulator [Jatrophihabitans sp.]|jgi:two-component system phosphate regulon response regulator PhoB|nr:response regulator [Jatrophihabitans sp.]